MLLLDHLEIVLPKIHRKSIRICYFRNNLQFVDISMDLLRTEREINNPTKA